MRCVVSLALALALTASAAEAVDRPAIGTPFTCAAPAALTAIGTDLDHTAARIERGGPLTIVALGSSSTRGVGATTPQQAYPSQLEIDLRKQLPRIDVRVINRGRNGEEVPQMLARIDHDVVAEHPDLVVWQLGTNAVLHGDSAASEQEPIASGIARLRQGGSDVVLMDLQYAPRVIARRGYIAMENVIADAAQHAHVGLFRRFAIMQQWQAARPDDPPRMIGRDGLHMTDQGYGCLASDLAQSLSASWQPLLRQAQGRNAPTLAHLQVAHPAHAEPLGP